jgi:hypothetical protein
MSIPHLEYVAMSVLIDWCGTKPRLPWPPRPTFTPERLVPRPIDTLIGNVYYLVLAGLILTTVATHPVEAVSWRYGPFMLVPAFRVAVGLFYNNFPAPDEKEVKGRR